MRRRTDWGRKSWSAVSFIRISYFRFFFLSWFPHQSIPPSLPPSLTSLPCPAPPHPPFICTCASVPQYSPPACGEYWASLFIHPAGIDLAVHGWMLLLGLDQLKAHLLFNLTLIDVRSTSCPCSVVFKMNSLWNLGRPGTTEKPPRAARIKFHQWKNQNEQTESKEPKPPHGHDMLRWLAAANWFNPTPGAF